MMRRLVPFAAVLVVVAAGAGCGRSQPDPVFTEVTFNGASPSGPEPGEALFAQAAPIVADRARLLLADGEAVVDDGRLVLTLPGEFPERAFLGLTAPGRLEFRKVLDVERPSGGCTPPTAPATPRPTS